VSLLRELAASLEDTDATAEDEEAGEGESTAAAAAAAAGGASLAWRQAYLGSQQPPLTLGPVCVKQAAGGCDFSVTLGPVCVKQAAGGCDFSVTLGSVCVCSVCGGSVDVCLLCDPGPCVCQASSRCVC
jgi:hypothetical protein